jgi:hypothetical protein
MRSFVDQARRGGARERKCGAKTAAYDASGTAANGIAVAGGIGSDA